MASKGDSIAGLDDLFQKLRDIEITHQSLAQQAKDARCDMMRCIICYDNYPPECVWSRSESEESSLHGPRLALCKQIEELDDLRASINEEVNTLLRPSLRPLNILSIPDEILIKIFRLIGDINDPRFCNHAHDWQAAQEVKNIRLTCWRFCATSSHLLLPRFCVELNVSSLSRLKEISHHPTISKGVRTIRVYTNPYLSELANNFQLFAAYNVKKFQTATEEARHPMELRLYKMEYKIPFEKYLERIKKAEAMSKSWSAMSDGTPDNQDDDEDLSYRMLLRRGHGLYQKCFQDQERMLADGSFVRAVATAMDRMPCTKKLEIIDDEGHLFKREDIYFMEDNDTAIDGIVINKMLAVPVLSLLFSDGPRMPSLTESVIKLLIEIPTAIYNAGIALRSLGIELNSRKGLPVLIPSQNDIFSLKAATQKLQTIHVELRGARNFIIGGLHPQQGEIEGINSFLGALLDTESLEHISLDLQYLNLHRSVDSLSTILNPRKWPKLSTLSCGPLSLHLNELEQFTHRRSATIKSVTMKDIHLLSGTWAEALDIMREIPMDSITLKQPTGAECENMSKAENEAIFGGIVRWEEDGPSKAERYIMGMEKHNPLRDPPAEESNKSSLDGSDGQSAKESSVED